MTSFENKLMIPCISKCFHLCRYIRIVRVQHLCRAQYEEFTSFTNYLKKITVWPKQMLIIPSDIQVYACTTFIAFLGCMLMMSTLNYHTVRHESSSNKDSDGSLKINGLEWK